MVNVSRYCAVEGCSFDRTRVVGESTLARFKRDPGGLIKSRGFNDGDLTEIALLGAVRREGKVPELLYALTSHQPRQKIFNVVQVAATILGTSRCIFLGKILAVLRFFDPGKVEICYCGEFGDYQMSQCAHVYVSTFFRHRFLFASGFLGGSADLFEAPVRGPVGQDLWFSTGRRLLGPRAVRIFQTRRCF